MRREARVDSVRRMNNILAHNTITVIHRAEHG